MTQAKVQQTQQQRPESHGISLTQKKKNSFRKVQVREKAVRVTSSLHFLRSFGTKNNLRWGEGEGTESLDEKTQLVSNSEIFTVKDIITHRLVICLFSFKKPAKCNINERLCPQ